MLRKHRLRVFFGGAPLLVIALLAFLVGVADAEKAQDGHLIVSLNGGITPRALPRHNPAPVGVRLAGRVITTDSSPLPRVNWIKLELAWRGVLNTKGLATCPRSRLESTSSRQALEHCREAQVGRGGLFALVFLPGEPALAVHARLVAFNGRTEAGRHAVLVHAYSKTPPVSFVIPFSVHHKPGAFRTVLVALIRRSVGPWPHVANFQILVSRKFNYEGERRSYLSASCPIPKGFTAGFLSFARATYVFADHHRLKAEAVRSCRAG